MKKTPLLIPSRFYDERKPLEPEYPSVPPSKAGGVYAKEKFSDVELERLLHAPPGCVYYTLLGGWSLISK